MAQQRSDEKPGIGGRFKAIFRSKENKITTLPQSPDPGENDEHRNMTMQFNGNKGPGDTIINNGQGNSASDMDENATKEDISSKLWNDAYENIRNKSGDDKRKLVIAYEKVLTQMVSNGELSTGNDDVELMATSEGKAHKEPNRFENCNRQTRIGLMQSAVKIVLEKTEKHAKSRGYIIQGQEIFDGVKETISLAMTSYPPAALAFSGLCATLPFLIKPLIQTKAMADGLSTILGSITWYMALSRLLLKEFRFKDHVTALRTVMEDKIVELYQSLLEYQIKCTIRGFGTRRIVTFLKDISGLENWDGKVKDFQKLEEAIRKDTYSYNAEVMKDAAFESNKNLKQMVSELRERNRQRQQEKTGKFNVKGKAYMERNPKPVSGTCLWFEDHVKFQEWVNNDSNLLIVTADAGCGKSVLSRHLVETLLPCICPKWFVCHFFFKDEAEQKNLSTGLDCVIHQLLSQTESLSGPAQKAINEAGDGLKDWRTLWDILQLLLKEIDKVIILFDALDETNSKDFKDWIIKLREDFFPESTTGVNMKVVFTTRPYSFVTDRLKSVSSGFISLQGEDDEEIEGIQREIELVVQYRLAKLVQFLRLQDDSKKALEDAFRKKGKDQKSYIWVNLAFELLEEHTDCLDTASHWQGLVNTISKGHIELYERHLDRVPIEHKDDVRIMLSIVIAAAFSLTAEQLDIAITVHKRFLSKPEAQYDDERSLDCRRERMGEWIRNTCRCFLTVYDSKVYFMHQTAKEFLLRSEQHSEIQPSNHVWHQSISWKQANATISEYWIAYISMVQFRRRHLEQHKFASVFLEHGLFHLQRCQVFSPTEKISSTESSMFKVSDVCKPFQSRYIALCDQPFDNKSSWLCQMFLRTKPDILLEAKPYPNFNIVYTSLFGHYNALVHLVQKHQSLDCLDKERTVIAAAFGGNLECLQYLLSQKYPASSPLIFSEPDLIKFSPPEAIIIEYQTALHWAAA